MRAKCSTGTNNRDIPFKENLEGDTRGEKKFPTLKNSIQGTEEHAVRSI